jgi:Cu2+-exporting ATPase
MIVTSLVVAGGALAVSAKVYRDKKREREYPWTVAAEKYRKRHRRKRLVDTLLQSAKPTESKSPFHAIGEATQNIKARLIAPLQEQVLTPLFGDTRSVHRQSLGMDDELVESNPKELAVKRDLATLSAQVVLAGIGNLFFPPLNVFVGLWVLYFTRFVYEGAYRSLREDRRITHHVLNAIIVSGLLLGRMIFAAALTGWFLFLIEWMVIKTEDRSRQSIVGLFNEQPHTVWVLVDGIEVEVPFEQISREDVLVVSAGQMVPVDGTIIEGTASIDQRVLTGEAQPVEKGVNDIVLASTLVLSGHIHVRVDKTGEETVTAQIGQMLTNTADFRENLRSETEIFVNRLTPAIVALGAFSYPFIGLSGTLGVLWSTPGYRMLYFGPISMLSFLHVASQKGILIKDGRSLEQFRKIDTVVFDKTGTLTEEQPYVSRVQPCSTLNEEALLQLAGAAEVKQTHPVALAILQAVEEQGLQLPATDDIHYELGYGIRVQVNGESVHVGSTRFMRMEGIMIPSEIQEMEKESHAQGCSVVMVALQHKLVGAIELSPTIRPEAKEIVQKLKQRGLDLYIISGDHARPTQRLAAELGIEHYFAEVLPEDKASLVEKLQKSGRSVCFVGDGINDSIALKKADVSVSLRGATTIATDTAQIVLMDESLRELDTLFSLGEEFWLNMRTNFIAATVPSVITAVGALFLGWKLMTVLLLTQLNTPVALYNSIRPLLKHNDLSEKDLLEDDDSQLD